MRIGLLIYGSIETLSGGYLYDRKLVEYLRAQGDTVEIISLPWRSYPRHLLDNLSFRLPAGLDLLIEDELNHPSLIGANAGRHPYPLISLVHHLRSSELHPPWLNRFYRLVEKRYLLSVDGFIFNSKTTRASVRSLAGREFTGVIAYPPTDRFGNAVAWDAAAARAHEQGPLRLVFVGNLMPRKGLHTLLGALSAAAPDFMLDVIGSRDAEPAYARRMQALAGTPPLAGRVAFHGALQAGELAKRLSRAQVMVVPSSYEGFGIVYLEGMGFGLPSIGTTAGAAGEIITDGKTGFLISPGDEGALAERLERLWRDRGLLAEMSYQALERYRRQPAWEKTAANIREYCASVLKAWRSYRVIPS